MRTLNMHIELFTVPDDVRKCLLAETCWLQHRVLTEIFSGCHLKQYVRWLNKYQKYVVAITCTSSK